MNVFESLDVGGPGYFRNDLFVYGRVYYGAAVSFPYSAKTGTYTLTESDSVVEATSGTFTVTLPTAVGISGRQYTVKNNGSGTVTVDGAGSETIDGQLTVILDPTHSAVTLQSNGAGWIVLSCISPVRLA